MSSFLKASFVQGRQHWPFCDQPEEREIGGLQGTAKKKRQDRKRFLSVSTQVIIRNAQGSDERDINVNIMGKDYCWHRLTHFSPRQANSAVDLQSDRGFPRQCARQLESACRWRWNWDHKVFLLVFLSLSRWLFIVVVVPNLASSWVNLPSK